MFTPLGKFNSVPCPKADQCELLNCIFSHKPALVRPAKEDVADETNVAIEPPTKRRKVDAPVSVAWSLDSIENGDRDQPGAEKNLHIANVKSLPKERNVPIESSQSLSAGEKTHQTSAPKREQVCKPVPALSVPRKPLASKGSTTSGRNGSQIPVQETLNPRKVARDPVGHHKRVLYLKKLHEEMTRLNKEVVQSKDANVRALHLTDGQMIKLALDEEETIARNSVETYANVIKLRMVAYKRMTVDQWKDDRLKAVQNQAVSEKANKSTESRSGAAHIDLDASLNEKEQLQILRRIFAPQDDLEKYGYVTRRFTEKEIAAAKAGVEASKGWEICARCQTRFQVYPWRQEDGSLTSRGKCVYHYGRALLPPKDKIGKAQGVLPKTYTCCNEPIGSSLGCTEADTHVFKVEDPKRLASVHQFVETPENMTDDVVDAVCFDCEMGFTVFGMELIRITAVSWPSAAKLLDVLVRPLGTTLDLNTRYSGVTPDQFSSAPSYVPELNGTKKATSKPESSSGQNGGREKETLMIVDSPDEARKLLFKLISPSTPLIGHAIENDLNAARIIHPCIVDTVLLFPHPAGLPRRRPLKGLAKELLGRDIQTGGAAGHDSLEDAVATGDLVRFKVAQKWKELRHRGWSFKDGDLIAPP